MEKRRPHFSLSRFKSVCGDADRLAMTVAASRSASELGFGPTEVSEVVRSMKQEQFYKSMTSYSDHRVWQDVYHVPWAGMVIYVKFTANVVIEFVLLSFKER